MCQDLNKASKACVKFTKQSYNENARSTKKGFAKCHVAALWRSDGEVLVQFDAHRREERTKTENAKIYLVESPRLLKAAGGNYPFAEEE